jgi:hypothetical protein
LAAALETKYNKYKGRSWLQHQRQSTINTRAEVGCSTRDKVQEIQGLKLAAAPETKYNKYKG